MIISRSTSCPYCGSEHFNLCYTVYDNGDYCFSCHKGHRKGAQHYAFRQTKESVVEESRNLVLPLHTSKPSEFSVTALEFLYSYYLSDKDIIDSKILYCEAQDGRNESLLFTIENEEGQIIEYQRRFFPKSFFSSSGMKKTLFLTTSNGDSSTLCLVEDYISAIRLSKHVHTLCLFGTDLRADALRYILEGGYTNIIIMLDPDKPGQDAASCIENKISKEVGIIQSKYALKYSTNYTIHNILTHKQAKELTNNEISKYLDKVQSKITVTSNALGVLSHNT